MRVVFCGTPEFAQPSLAALVSAGVDVPLVVSQPDRVRGRRGKPTPCPVRALAIELGIDTAVLEKGKREALYQQILGLQPDAIVVVAFGHIIREPLLTGTRCGCINVHASLLPRWRGPAPVHTAIVAGDLESGVCTMRLEAGVDTGDVYLRESTKIEANETAGQLHDRLALMGSTLLVETVMGLEDGTLLATPQSQEGITHAPMLDKSEGSVAFDAPANRVHDRIRGLHPWPGVTVGLNGRRVKIAATSCANLDEHGHAPGTVVGIDDAGALVACSQGAILVRQFQSEGRKPITAMEFSRGHGLSEGALLQPLDTYQPKEPRA